jgi:hypothetical protein
MAEKGKSTRDDEWAEAYRKCRLNLETLQMAKEMGLNPRSLIKNIPAQSEKWKAPVKVWIQEMYEKRKEKARKKLEGRKKREEAKEEQRGRDSEKGDTAGV